MGINGLASAFRSWETGLRSLGRHDAVVGCLQVGIMTPEPASTGQLCTGQVGYVITGMKSTRSARVGDTWHLVKQPVEMLPGFKPTKSMVFAGDALRLFENELNAHEQAHGLF
jgi:translation elongation factor EF-4